MFERAESPEMTEKQQQVVNQIIGVMKEKQLSFREAAEALELTYHELQHIASYLHL